MKNIQFRSAEMSKGIEAAAARASGALGTHERALRNLEEAEKKAGLANQQHEQATKALAISHRQLGMPIAATISQFSELSPAANLASNAIVSMTLASGPAGIALGVLAGVTGLLIYRIREARQNLANLAERELAGIAREGKLLTAEQALKDRARLRNDGDKARQARRFGGDAQYGAPRRQPGARQNCKRAS